MKSTVDEIRTRFDNDVDRFSNLETGQTATIDAPLIMALVAKTAAAVTPMARAALDIGCGAGNYTLSLLKELPGLDCTLLDLSAPMLLRAEVRVGEQTQGVVRTIQGDIREIYLGSEQFDVAMAAMTLHHLRTDEEWEAVFRAVFLSLKPGGCFWIADLVESGSSAIQDLFWKRYGEYLTGLKGEEYRDHVLAYVTKEDTPKPLLWQLDLLKLVGFNAVEVLHKNTCFAAFGGIKS